MVTTKTKVVNARIPAETYEKVKAYADKKGITISEWLTPIIIRATSAGKKQ